MGIEITARATIPHRGFLRRHMQFRSLLERIRDTIKQLVDDPLLRRGVHFEITDNQLYSILHPAGAPLVFTFDEKQEITAQCKTSTAGPGFHLFVLTLLKRIEEKCDLKWKWELDNIDSYEGTIKINELKISMATILKVISRHMLKEEQTFGSPRLILWPINNPTPKDEEFAISPMGVWPRIWWESISEATDTDLQKKAAEFYPWWEPTLDATFWRNYSIVLMWQDVLWHVPTDLQEKKTCQLAIDCAKRARELDSKIVLPEKELNELQGLLQVSVEDSLQPPNKEGIGFHRRNMMFRTGSNWSIKIPGYFYSTEEDDGKTDVFWYARRTVRVSSFTVARKDGAAIPVNELLETIKFETENAVEKVIFEQGNLKGEAAVTRQLIDGMYSWMLQGQMACGGGANTVAFTSITYDNLEEKDWAIRTFKSLSHP